MEMRIFRAGCLLAPALVLLLSGTGVGQALILPGRHHKQYVIIPQAAPVAYTAQAPVAYTAQAPVAYAAQAPAACALQAPVAYTAQAPVAYTAQAPATYTLQAPTTVQAAPASYTVQIATTAQAPASTTAAAPGSNAASDVIRLSVPLQQVLLKNLLAYYRSETTGQGAAAGPDADTDTRIGKIRDLRDKAREYYLTLLGEEEDAELNRSEQAALDRLVDDVVTRESIQPQVQGHPPLISNTLPSGAYLVPPSSPYPTGAAPPSAFYPVPYPVPYPVAPPVAVAPSHCAHRTHGHCLKCRYGH